MDNELKPGDMALALHSRECRYGDAHPTDQDEDSLIGRVVHILRVDPNYPGHSYPKIKAWVVVEEEPRNRYCAGCFQPLESDISLEEISRMITAPLRVDA